MDLESHDILVAGLSERKANMSRWTLGIVDLEQGKRPVMSEVELSELSDVVQSTLDTAAFQRCQKYKYHHQAMMSRMHKVGLNLGSNNNPTLRSPRQFDAFLYFDHAAPGQSRPPTIRPPAQATRMDDRPASSALLTPPELSPLEQEVLDEYERLADNMKNVRLAMPFP